MYQIISTFADHQGGEFHLQQNSQQLPATAIRGRRNSQQARNASKRHFDLRAQREAFQMVSWREKAGQISSKIRAQTGRATGHAQISAGTFEIL